MVLMGVDMPLRAIQGLIASAIDILIHLDRKPDGGRRLTEITELIGLQDGEYRMNPLFRMEYAGVHKDPIRPEEMMTPDYRLRSVGMLSCKQKLVSEGLSDEYAIATETYRRMEDDNKGPHSR